MSSAGMTCDAMWHSARRLRMLSKMSIDVRPFECLGRYSESTYCVFLFFEQHGP